MLASYTHLNQRHTEQGFTLVELAIVLVIIGLIIGGVLVGQDMIKSAEIRSTIAQRESYAAGINTFRDKYGYLPGDINQARAKQFGLFDRTAVAAAGNGDGNGLLQACAQTAAAGLLAGCETTVFWRDLNSAGLVDGFFQVAGSAVAAIGNAALITVFPETKIGRGNFWTVFSAEGKNWFEIAGITDVTGAGVYTLTTSLSPFEAYNIDRKVDDSRPLSGGTRAMTSLSALNSLAVANTAVGGATCVAADSTYNQTSEANANTPACQLRLNFM